jgi:hypothetical protein
MYSAELSMMYVVYVLNGGLSKDKMIMSEILLLDLLWWNFLFQTFLLFLVPVLLSKLHTLCK